MYVSFILLSSYLCVITAQVTFDKNGEGITNMLSHPIPANTEEALFQHNSITHIPVGYFQNLPNLGSIVIYTNLISEIGDNAFSAVPSVTFINLDNNKLEIVNKSMFAGLPNLQELKLNYNLIHTVQMDSFKDNTALTKLWLFANSLESLPQCVFDPDNQPAGLTLRVYNNPMTCDQSWCWVKQAEGDWITVPNPSGTTCSGPAALSGRTWDTLTEQDFNCEAQGEYLLILIRLPTLHGLHFNREKTIFPRTVGKPRQN